MIAAVRICLLRSKGRAIAHAAVLAGLALYTLALISGCGSNDLVFPGEVMPSTTASVGTETPATAAPTFTPTPLPVALRVRASEMPQLSDDQRR